MSRFKSAPNADGMGQQVSAPLGEYVDLGSHRIPCCEFRDDVGERCTLPGTVSTGGSKFMCMPHRLLTSGNIDATECAEMWRRKRIGLHSETHEMFEAFHEERLSKGIDAAHERLRRMQPQSLPYNPQRRHG